ncbi:tautomerase family protein [Pseudomonas aeruginosa]|uniref:tautomerase family protein n=1 Tax=Pseudomonas aeruginosa TaxID=287 RepID=UPI00071772DE|nr:tautomerase family protein [Pseudomonas aeruginosa]KRV32161.1 4-oxalocrotonate tautomerase [Pseudomonas aeruginosa]KSF44345.1 4-oxalocrotonate tautomerase [Pseudomonas aeruginosa]MCT5235661.1 tautomerase family protein [Pseudomonas aeruginosa]MCV6434588.1 tautomerase family protein [Pseudomonas aeruginosa]MCV6442201.1 tautomerase family protein [Pseudomonas aeruginosa]
MPIIEMHMVEGRTSEQKSRVALAVTEAVCKSLECPAEAVRILITEHGGDEFYHAGMNMAQRAAKKEGQLQ